MAKPYVRYVLCDPDHPDGKEEPFNQCGTMFRTFIQALKAENVYLVGNPGAYIAKVTYERATEPPAKERW